MLGGSQDDDEGGAFSGPVTLTGTGGNPSTVTIVEGISPRYCESGFHEAVSAGFLISYSGRATDLHRLFGKYIQKCLWQ